MKKLLFTLAGSLLTGLSFATPPTRPVYGTGNDMQTHPTGMQSLRTHSETPDQLLNSVRNNPAPYHLTTVSYLTIMPTI